MWQEAGLRVPLFNVYLPSPLNWRVSRPLLPAVLALGLLVGCGQETTVEAPISTIQPTTTAAPPPSTADTTLTTPEASPRLQTTSTPEPVKPTKPVASLNIPPVLITPAIVLELSSSDIPLETSKSITVSGTASPGATVSINGVLALPTASGSFSADLTPTSVDQPFLIEVVASTVFGDNARSTAAAMPQGDGVDAWTGTVTKVSRDHRRTVAEETNIALTTSVDQVDLTATPATIVHIPGQRGRLGEQTPIPSIEDVAVGDRVAVSASGGQVLHLLVLDEGPLDFLHFPGIVLSSPSNSKKDAFLTLLDAQGNRVQARLAPELQAPLLGTLVTAVLVQPLYGGDFIVEGLDPAVASLDRITTALEQAKRSGDEETAAGLVRALAETAARTLTFTNGFSKWPDAILAARLRSESAALEDVSRQTLSTFGGASILLRVEGIITSLRSESPQVREMTIETPSGVLGLFLDSRTEAWLTPAGTPPSALQGWLNALAGAQNYADEYGGSTISANRLDVGQRVIASYHPETLAVARVSALASQRLDEDLVLLLAPLAEKGEMVGTVANLDKRGTTLSVYVQNATPGVTMVFPAPADLEPLVDGRPTPWGDGIIGREVAILFEPESRALIEMSTVASTPGQTSVSGVVSSFVSKIFPGNATIVTTQGEFQTFSHNQETVIRRDGRRISASDVTMGDLVRPNSRHWKEDFTKLREGIPVLTLLSLKSPGPTPFSGAVRGISRLGDGIAMVTFSNYDLELITLEITAGTQLTRLGTEISADSLLVGDEIINAVYDPISLKVIQLNLSAATLQNLDCSDIAVTVGRKADTAVDTIVSGIHSDPPCTSHHNRLGQIFSAYMG